MDIIGFTITVPTVVTPVVTGAVVDFRFFGDTRGAFYAFTSVFGRVRPFIERTIFVGVVGGGVGLDLSWGVYFIGGNNGLFSVSGLGGVGGGVLGCLLYVWSGHFSVV